MFFIVIRKRAGISNSMFCLVVHGLFIVHVCFLIFCFFLVDPLGLPLFLLGLTTGSLISLGGVCFVLAIFLSYLFKTEKLSEFLNTNHFWSLRVNVCIFLFFRHLIESLTNILRLITAINVIANISVLRTSLVSIFSFTICAICFF